MRNFHWSAVARVTGNYRGVVKLQCFRWWPIEATYLSNWVENQSPKTARFSYTFMTMSYLLSKCLMARQIS